MNTKMIAVQEKRLAELCPEAEKEVAIVAVYSSSSPLMTIAQTANKQGGDGRGRSTHLGLQRAVSVREC